MRLALRRRVRGVREEEEEEDVRSPPEEGGGAGGCMRCGVGSTRWRCQTGSAAPGPLREHPRSLPPPSERLGVGLGAAVKLRVRVGFGGLGREPGAG